MLPPAPLAIASPAPANNGPSCLAKCLNGCSRGCGSCCSRMGNWVNYHAECTAWTTAILLVIAIILICVLVPLSFHYIDYGEMGFTRNKYGTVDTSEVLTYGRYFRPINYEIITFPATVQFITFLNAEGDGLAVFSSAGLEFIVDVVFGYRLTPANLADIYNRFGTNYANLIHNMAKSGIKDVATQFTTEDYINNRDQVRSVFANKVISDVQASVGVEVPPELFILLNIKLPQSLMDRSLLSATELQNNTIQLNQQAVTIITAETQTLIASIYAEKARVLAYANTTAQQMISNSQVNSNNLLTTARGQGLGLFFTVLNISEPTKRKDIIKLMSILDAPAPKVMYNLSGVPLINI